MEDAMTNFASGLAVQADKRARREKCGLLEVTAAELVELDILVEKLSASPKRASFSGMIGFAMLIRDLFAKVRERIEKDPSLSAHDAFANVIKPFNALMFSMDAHYFTRPEGETVEGKMAALVAFAESQEE